LIILLSAYLGTNILHAQRLSFDGTDDFARIDTTLFTTGDFTVEGIFQTCPFSVGTKQQELLSNGTFSLRFSVNATGSLAQFQMEHDGLLFAYQAPLYAHQQSFHFAAQYRTSDSTWTLYFNGDSLGSHSAVFTPRDTTVIGGSNGGFFKGYLSDFGVADSLLYSGFTYQSPGSLQFIRIGKYWDFSLGMYQGAFFSHNNLPLKAFNGLDAVEILTAPSDSIFTCEIDTIVLLAAGGRFYQWGSTALLFGNGTGNAGFNATADFTGSITISDSNGCNFSKNFAVVHRPFSHVNLGADTSICAGQTITLDAGIHNQYIWLHQPTAGRTVTVGGGTWYVIVIDSGYCQGNDSIIITEFPSPSINLGPDQNLPFGYAVKLSPGPGYASYRWSTGESSDTILATLSLTYTVTVTDSNGCLASDAINIYFFGALGLSSTAKTALPRAYPNPVRDRLFIEGMALQMIWQIIDANGTLVCQGKSTEHARTEIDLSLYRKGIYVFRIAGSDACHVLLKH
jgi:hypothetical protein